MYLDIWYLLTLIGSPYLWVAIAGILFAVFLIMRHINPKSPRGGYLKRFLFILIPALVITFVLLVSLKAIVNIERVCIPCPAENCNPYCPLDSSFPSGHTTAIFTGFSSAFLVLRERRFLILFIIPLLVGASRLALAVHTWYDVVVGAFIGIVIPLLVYKADKKFFGEFG